jgi:hypothetical protein
MTCPQQCLFPLVPPRLLLQLKTQHSKLKTWARERAHEPFFQAFDSHLALFVTTALLQARCLEYAVFDAAAEDAILVAMVVMHGFLLRMRKLIE